jgi:hypothetical protein
MPRIPVRVSKTSCGARSNDDRVPCGTDSELANPLHKPPWCSNSCLLFTAAASLLKSRFTRGRYVVVSGRAKKEPQYPHVLSTAVPSPQMRFTHGPYTILRFVT